MRRAERLTVNEALCKACCICVALCPRDVFDAGALGVPVVARLEACNVCRFCELHCPDFAITIVGMSVREPGHRLGRGPLMPARLMEGNEAVAEGAIAAGCRFFAGYPITPSTEIAEVLSQRLPEVGGKFIQMEDEIASMAAVIGASLAGAKALTATSGPGFSLMQETIGYAAMAQIPCVIVDVMRGGPSTGLPTDPAQGDVMQARWGTHGEHSIIALAPSSVRECFTLTVEASTSRRATERR